MKKIHLILASTLVLGFASSAFATAVCTAFPKAQDGTAVTGNQGNFIQTTFTPKCSGNVFLDYEQDNLAVGIGAASKKGKSLFKGNSNGGAVAKVSDCASTTTGCTQTETATQATAGLTDSHSS